MNIFDYTLQLFAEEAQSGEAEQNADENGTDAVSADNDREFDELIRGKFKDSFAKRTQSIIDRRFAKTKAAEQTARDVEPLLGKLRETVPGGAELGTGELIERFIGSLDKKDAGQPETEKSGDDILRLAQLAARKKAAEQTVGRWEKEAEELKEIYPAFSLEGEMTGNEKFSSLIRAGLPVRLAFEAANLEQIMSSAMKYAAENAGLKTAQSIQAGAGRVQENPVLDRAASVRRRDVSSLTEKDIMKIITEVSKGAKITF